MVVDSVKSIETYTPKIPANTSSGMAASATTEKTINAASLTKPETESTAKPKAKIEKQDMENLTGELNKFMQMVSADLHFAVHEKTQQVMVQLRSDKDDKVLREFPSHELLDVMAKIRDYVGALLDKKA